MRRRAAVILLAFLLAVLVLTGCGRVEMAVTENTGKLIRIEAKGAGRDAFLITGSLQVEENEKIVITSGLKKGGIKVEIFTLEGADDINSVPDIGGADVIITANLGTGDSLSGTVAPGDYMLRATCTETATGTVTAEVLPAG